METLGCKMIRYYYITFSLDNKLHDTVIETEDMGDFILNQKRLAEFNSSSWFLINQVLVDRTTYELYIKDIA